MRKTLLITIPIVLAIIIIVAFITQIVVDNANAWKVEITNDYYEQYAYIYKTNDKEEKLSII